jgi:hypothetical protein
MPSCERPGKNEIVGAYRPDQNLERRRRDHDRRGVGLLVVVSLDRWPVTQGLSAAVLVAPAFPVPSAEIAAGQPARADAAHHDRL